MRTRQKVITCIVVMMAMILSLWRETFPTQAAVTSTTTAPFYGIWCQGSKDASEIQEAAGELCRAGFDARVFVTTEWSNLNSDCYYVVTAGIYDTQTQEEKQLSAVKAIYKDAYIKYSGTYQGNDG